MLIFINHLLLYVGGDGLAVPPLWSGFPDFGPDPDFFDQTSLEFSIVMPLYANANIINPSYVNTLAVPPTRSGFPDSGPDLDFFDQTGPDLVRNFVTSPDF